MKFNLLYALAFAAMSVIFTACDDDLSQGSKHLKIDKLMGQSIDSGIIEELQSGVNANYVLTDYALFDMDAWSNNKWELVDLSEWSGWSVPLPTQIIFSDGKCIGPFKMSGTLGPHPLALPWEAYKKSTSKNIDVMIASPLTVSTTDRSMIIGNRTCNVERCEGNLLTLSVTSHYEGGRTQKGGEELWIQMYERNESVNLSNDNIRVFDSEKDACSFIMTLLRERFGNVIPVNKIFAPSVIFENGEINIDDLEKKLEAWYAERM